MGAPYGKWDTYYSHIFRDSYGSGMGIVWVRSPIIGGSLKIPLIPGPAFSLVIWRVEYIL